MPLPVTFHRAFDAAADRHAALETLVQLRMARVLSSGSSGADGDAAAATTALDGLPGLRALQDRAAGRIIVVPAGGIDPSGVARIVASLHCRELHGAFRTPRITRCGTRTYTRLVCDAAIVRQVVANVAGTR